MSENSGQNAKQTWVTPIVTELPSFTDLTLQSGNTGGGGGGPVIGSLTGTTSGTFSV